MRLRVSWLVVPLIAVAMGGCASPDATDSAGAPAPSSSSAGPPAAASPSRSQVAPSGSVSGATTRLTGVVADGVEPGCVLLNTGDKTYLLIGGDRSALKAGARITVTGTPEPQLMSTCQQGTPFRVAKVEG